MHAPTLNLELPEWPGAKVFLSTRVGGVSSAPYNQLNLGDHVGDDPASVVINRARLAAGWGVQPVFLNQTHGTEVVWLDSDPGLAGIQRQADASVTDRPGLACTILVADCLPVMFYLPSKKRVAAAHAGWRGLAAGVLENTLDQLGHKDPSDALHVWLGPCIGPTAFEVGEDVLMAFQSQEYDLSGCFKPKTAGKWWADLAGLARHRLSHRGVNQVQGNDGTQAWCTFSNPEHFFSHRRDRISGRMAAGVALLA